MKLFLSSTSALALAVLLAACGGGDEGIIVNEHEPSPSGASATVTVSGATGADVGLNGVYTTGNLSLNNVTKVNPIGEHETCRFRFAGPTEPAGGKIMDGDIRYLPGTNALDTTFVSIATVEFRLEGTTGATVDRTNNRVTYTGAVLTSTQSTGRTIVLTGSIPMRGDRPEGC
ncbi:MAG: hypothetical protein JWQ76_5627 [Ramlibacter sp.]|nr:hypothetical protein [Ramlibacter sp.]